MRLKLFAGAIVAVFLLAVAYELVRYDLAAYALLARFLDPTASGPLLRRQSRAVSIENVTIAAPDGPIPARLYLPQGVAHPPGMVIVHGIHHLGIDEPRVVSLARAAAEGGFAVLTPLIASLADYHVDADAIPAIGLAPGWLEQQLASGPVTVIAVSFGGGLALLAAADPQYAAHMRGLVLMGAYSDLERVSRFLATDEVVFPDGRTAHFAAHEYGALVLIYAHLDRFFPVGDLPVAKEALRDFLWEKPELAQPLLLRLSPAARATMDTLLAHQVQLLRPQLLAVIAESAPQLAALSPGGRLANLSVPVFILHGADDNVIPDAESLWLAREVPPRELRAVLITPAFSHADPEKGARWYEELKLVHFLGKVLRASS